MRDFCACRERHYESVVAQRQNVDHFSIHFMRIIFSELESSN